MRETTIRKRRESECVGRGRERKLVLEETESERVQVWERKERD